MTQRQPWQCPLTYLPHHTSNTSNHTNHTIRPRVAWQHTQTRRKKTSTTNGSHRQHWRHKCRGPIVVEPRGNVRSRTLLATGDTLLNDACFISLRERSRMVCVTGQRRRQAARYILGSSRHPMHPIHPRQSRRLQCVNQSRISAGLMLLLTVACASNRPLRYRSRERPRVDFCGNIVHEERKQTHHTMNTDMGEQNHKDKHTHAALLHLMMSTQ
jgi:hypothetical protein